MSAHRDSDILELLVQAITVRAVPVGVYEVGGPDVVTYTEMMALYARAAGLPDGVSSQCRS